MKNQDLLLFLLIAIFGFLIWNRANGENFVDVSADKPVEPSTIQTIINAVQAKVPDLYPIQTVYINPFQGDQGSMVYNARIIFLNTRGYFGVQYDIKADSRGNILEMSEQPTPAMTGPFMAYTGDSYEKFDDIQTVLDQQFADLKTQVPGYESKLDNFLDSQAAYGRARATQAARAPYEKLAETTGKAGYLGSGALAYSE
jgi:hypothetical protein